MKPMTRKVLYYPFGWILNWFCVFYGTFLEWIENDKGIIDSFKDSKRIMFDK